MQVKEGEDENIQCHKCLEIYRVLSTKLNKRQFNRLLNNNNDKFLCQMCREVDELKKAVKYLNPNMLRNHCAISGTEVGGNAVEAVMKLMEKLDVPLTANDFEGAYIMYSNKLALVKEFCILTYNIRSISSIAIFNRFKTLAAKLPTLPLYTRNMISEQSDATVQRSWLQNGAINNFTLPEIHRVQEIISIPNGSHLGTVGTYRPISNLSIIDKIFDKILRTFYSKKGYDKAVVKLVSLSMNAWTVVTLI
ncbi:hypothetical protein GQX74_012867 [Glossina fuscipes]|nr:hypothetical protein GQX74_012867 [Glossina fuscipes]